MQVFAIENKNTGFLCSLESDAGIDSMGLQCTYFFLTSGEADDDENVPWITFSQTLAEDILNSDVEIDDTDISYPSGHKLHPDTHRVISMNLE